MSHLSTKFIPFPRALEQSETLTASCPVDWGNEISRLLLCCEFRSTPNDCPGYCTKQSDGEVPVMQEFWGMWSNPSLPSLPGLLWWWVVAPDKVLSLGKIELNSVLCKTELLEKWLIWHLICVLMLNWSSWNRTVFEYKTELFERKLFLKLKLNCLIENCFDIQLCKPNYTYTKRNYLN